MRADARLLVIGPSALSEATNRAMPGRQIVNREHLLDGVWQFGKQSFDGVLLSLSSGKKALRALRSLREMDPGARIVVSCMPRDEPAARLAMTSGADEYILEPLAPEDLEHSFHAGEARMLPPRPLDAGSAADDLKGLGEALQSLDRGPKAALEHFAALLQKAFGAGGVTIRLDDLSASVGDVGAVVLEKAILRQGKPVGRVSLLHRVTEPGAAADRLDNYARLIEAAVAQARECRRWRDLAWTDDLSGLRNRRYIEQALADLIGRALERRLRLTVLLFDIDDFKTYNDRYGHDCGDSLIREVATLLTHCSRERDVVARFGGDEFVVVFWDAEKPRIPGSKHPTEPIALAERFRRAMRDHAFECLGPSAPGPVTISGGLASFPWDGGTAKELISAADKALLMAKRTGKNRIALAGGSPDEEP